MLSQLLLNSGVNARGIRMIAKRGCLRCVSPILLLLGEL
jgi:hypothetical protein